VDPEIATGMYDATTDVIDVVSGVDVLSANEGIYEYNASETDQFRDGIGEVSAFTPFTNPSTALYWYDPADVDYYDPANCELRQQQIVYSGLSFYNMEFTPGTSGDGTAKVTIYFDGTTADPNGFPTGPGAEWQGNTQVTSDVVVPAGEELSVADGAEVVVAAYADAAGSGALDGMVEILVDGTMSLGGSSGILFTSSRDSAATHDLGDGVVYGEGAQGAAPDSGDWYGVKVSDSGQVTGSATTFKYATGALNFATSTFPDLSGHGSSPFTFQHNLLDVTFDRDVSLIPWA
jgi:hypothetical protein